MTEVELKQYFQHHFPKENEACEWKDFTSLKHSFGGKAGDDVISYISAIANMEGGHLVVGITDKTQDIKGIEEFNNYTAQNIKLKIIEKCTNINSEKLKVEEFKTSDTQKIVWVFHVPKHLPRLIVYSHSKAWQRVEDSLVDLKKERQDAILKEPISVNEDWSAKIIPTSTLDDLDPKAILKAREEYKEKHPKRIIECDHWDDATFLNKAKVTIQGKITNTAILLLGKEEAVHFISPAIAKISWVLKDEHNLELDYEHFSIPFLSNSSEVFAKVRNLTYRYIKDDSLFPTEIKMYDAFVIREALHNCIAHQDYALQGRITVVEKPDELIFSNVGSFIPKTVETVIEQDAPQEYYRNAFLAEAMVNLNMIDTIGSGIKRMFIKQRERFFPLPDFNLNDPYKVVVKIAGRIWDENYTKLLMSKTDLALKTVVLLDRVQKSLPITDSEINQLKKLKLIEGRKPNLYISATIAGVTGEKTDYIKNKGFDNKYYRDLILEFITTFKHASRNELENLLEDKLPKILSEQQKKDKVKNSLQYLKNKDKIQLGADMKWMLKHGKN
jgi:ATP-dependent DNA helicase RecG